MWNFFLLRLIEIKVNLFELKYRFPPRFLFEKKKKTRNATYENRDKLCIK